MCIMLCSSWLYLQTVQVQPAHLYRYLNIYCRYSLHILYRYLNSPIHMKLPVLREEWFTHSTGAVLPGLQLMAEVVLGRVLCLNNTGKNVDIDPPLHILKCLFQNSQR